MNRPTGRPLARSVVAALALGIAMSAGSAPVRQDGINESASLPTTHWTIDNGGWMYTPGAGYTLNGVYTRFNTCWNGTCSGPATTKTLTVEVWDERPGSGPANLLRSATFMAGNSSSDWVGGIFADLDLLGGEDYFIGFKGLAGVGTNLTEDAGATNLGGLWYGNPGTEYQALAPLSNPAFSQPLLRFMGEPAARVPEPGSLALVAAALLCLLCLRQTFEE